MIRKTLPAILGAIVVVLMSVSCFAQDTDANQQESKEILSGKKATPRGTPKPEADSADIPPFARGRIDAETYLRLRNELVATKRGIFDLMRDPQARLRGVLQMNRQEELIRRLQSNLKASQSANGVIRPEFLISTWSPLGPDPIPNGQTDPNLNPANEVPVSGRVTGIAIDPTDTTGNTVYVGTAQGGLYFTQDGGTTWTALMDSAASLAIGAITIDPLDHNTVFVGTGEGNFSLDSFFGVGLYIIQGATTGAPTLSGPFNSNGTSDVFTGRAITQILVNPSNDNLILVSTVSGASGMSGDEFSTLPIEGVYLSTNALSGAPTFTRQTIQTAFADRAVTDMAMDPGNANTIVVNVFGLASAGDGGIWVSTSGNPWAGTAAWSQRITKQAIGKLAVNRSGTTPATTFFATFDEMVTCGASSVGGTMSKSTNGGVTWVSIPAARGFCGGQCFYDMAPAIDPGNVNTIYLGGSAHGGTVGSCGSGVLAKSTNGGTSFAASDSSLHADSHATAIAPGNHIVVYAGNDGGVFRSGDGGVTWSSINTTGFNATQFESLAIHPSDPNFTIGGTQDNGTPFMMPDGTWTRADFGDGGFSAIDQSAADTTNVTMYHTYFNQTNNLIGFAQVTSVATATEANWGFFGCGGTANGINCADSVLFYAPMALGPGTPNTFYFGTDHLYRSANQGTTMTSVSQSPLIAASPNNIRVSAIGIAAQDDNFRIVGMANGHVFATTTGSNTLTDVTGGWTLKYIARAVIDPNNKNTAYVTLDGYGTPSHVWKTTNLSGTPPTWAAASSGIPDVPVNAFAVDPLNTNFLYAGTDIGVYNSIDGGATWNPYGLGLPRVAVFDLKEYRVLRKIRIATHGRGIWEITAVTNFADTIGLLPSSQKPVVGTNVMLTAAVNKGTGVPVPTGTVTFLDGASALGTGSLDDSGTATFQTAGLSLGSHSLSATYGGDSLYAPSSSAATMITVTNPPDFAVNVPNTTRTVDAGQSAAYAIALTPQNGFSAPVKFDCSGLPSLANCAFEPATLTPSGSDTASILIISTTAHALSAALPVSTIVASALTGFGLLGLVIAGCATGRKRMWQSGVLLLIAVAMVTAVAGCNGHTRTINPMTGTPAGAYSVTVTATSGSTAHQTNLTLIVR